MQHPWRGKTSKNIRVRNGKELCLWPKCVHNTIHTMVQTSVFTIIVQSSSYVCNIYRCLYVQYTVCLMNFIVNSMQFLSLKWSKRWTIRAKHSIIMPIAHTHPNSVYQLTMGWMGQRLNPSEGEIFCTHPDQPWDLLSLHQVCPSRKATGAWRWPPTTI